MAARMMSFHNHQPIHNLPMKRTRDSIIHTARSLRELALRGEDGERDNATAMFHAFMQRHGLKEDDLGSDHVKPHVFNVPTAWQWLLIQVASTVLGDVLFNNTADTVTVPCAEEDVPHIWSKFERYRSAYMDEEHLLRLAFIHVQQLKPRHEPLHPPVSNAPKPTARPSGPAGTAFDTPSDTQPDAHHATSESHHATSRQEPYPNPEQRGILSQWTDLQLLQRVIRKISYRIPIGPMPDVPVAHK
jgi:hypothetical protein